MSAPLTDEQITKMAKARVAFKMHAIVYVCVNVFLMAIWMITGGADEMHRAMWSDGWSPGYYWPIWTHLGWGLGLAIHGFTTYGPGSNMLQREEEKLRRDFGKP